MPRPRLPQSKAKVEGKDAKDPQRFRKRREPKASELGAPPPWMTKEQKKVWEQFSVECPWLNNSHRSLLEIAVTVRVKLIQGQEVGVQALSLLRQCLGQMGATPADATKVTIPDDSEEDPDDALFSRPN